MDCNEESWEWFPVEQDKVVIGPTLLSKVSADGRHYSPLQVSHYSPVEMIVRAEREKEAWKYMFSSG